MIDGVPLTDLHLRNYRKQVGYVSQEPILFNTSIKKNIQLGKKDASNEEIEDALKKTNAWEFVSKYKDGIETMTGDKGGQLSGG